MVCEVQPQQSFPPRTTEYRPTCIRPLNPGPVTQGVKPARMPSLFHQFGTLLLLAIPIASIAWTVTHEEVFREPREWCADKSRDCRKLMQRKFFYLRFRIGRNIQ